MRAKEPATDGSAPASARPSLGSVLFSHLPLELETALFLFVSMLDLLLTLVMLRSGAFAEANPVARWVLRHWGLRGIIRFKVLFLVVICVLAQAVARRAPERAGWILNVGTTLVGLTVGFSLLLMARAVL